MGIKIRIILALTALLSVSGCFSGAENVAAEEMELEQKIDGIKGKIADDIELGGAVRKMVLKQEKRREKNADRMGCTCNCRNCRK